MGSSIRNRVCLGARWRRGLEIVLLVHIRESRGRSKSESKSMKGIKSCGDRSGGEMAFAGMGGGNDDADRFLVEAFETAVTLEIFQMAADCAFLDELIELLLGDQFVR